VKTFSNFSEDVQLGKDHPDTALSLNNLAFLYYSQGKYAEAEPLYRRALDITEKALGKDHPSTARSLNNLALLYHSQRKYAEAEPLYQQLLTITEAALGSDHPALATTLNSLAVVYRVLAAPRCRKDTDHFSPAHPALRRRIDELGRPLRSLIVPGGRQPSIADGSPNRFGCFVTYRR
jgi:tetratricopeptide (TPR) repeat protein